MTFYALIIGGRVAEVFPESVEMEFSGEPTEVDPTGGPVTRAVPLSERYTAEFIAQLVPFDPDNPPAAPVIDSVPIPTSVTMRQARLALLSAGKLQAVADAISALPSPQKEAAQIEWEFAATVDRASPFVVLLGSALSLDDAELDALFTAAAAL